MLPLNDPNITKETGGDERHDIEECGGKVRGIGESKAREKQINVSIEDVTSYHRPFHHCFQATPWHL